MDTAIGKQIVTIAYKAARAYLAEHNLGVSEDSLAACIKSWCKIKLPEALADAKEAYECGMEHVATQTFAATFAVAGIEAAKEAGFPQ